MAFPLRQFLADNPDVAARIRAIQSISSEVRTSQYFLTRACNIRCKGCWFFTYGLDKQADDEKDLGEIDRFLESERARGITAALLVGGEPTLVPKKVERFVRALPFVTVTTNGWRPLPVAGFENVAVAVSLFAGHKSDDAFRAIRPNGDTFTGLFETALGNYHNDRRATFVYAMTEQSSDEVIPTVRRIRDNGNRVVFSYYRFYAGGNEQENEAATRRLLDRALAAKDLMPETITNTPYVINALISGKTEWGEFSGDTCPSVSFDHPSQQQRVRNGHPTLPGFRAYAQDLKTVNSCCTSGDCHKCRDSQAVTSWLMVNARKFFHSEAGIREWLGVCEGYWSGFVWSPFHPSKAGQHADLAIAV